MKENDESYPFPMGDYFYYSRTRKGKEYPIFCRKKNRHSSQSEVLLDLNDYTKNKSFVSLGGFEISSDQKTLAFALDLKGDESFQIFTKDLQTRKLRKEVTKKITYGLEWLADSKSFLYVTYDRSLRPFRVYKHRLGRAQSQDQLIYEEKESAFHINLRKSRDGKFLFLYSESQTTTEIWLLETGAAKTQPQLFLKRKNSVQYELESNGAYFYIRTNENEKNFKIDRLLIADWKKGQRRVSNWYTPPEDTCISEFTSFKGALVLGLRKAGLKYLSVHSLKNFGSRAGRGKAIKFPDPSYDLQTEFNEVFDSSYFRFCYTSFLQPRTIYDLELATGNLILRKQEQIPHYHPQKYEMRRLLVKTSDGVKIPVSVIRRKNKVKKPQPFLLEGYGAYGIAFDAEFDQRIFSLLDRGFAYAIAHIRGGGEFGEHWHEAGKCFQKKNTFKDFAAVASDLVKRKITLPEMLFARGRSAGGLLIGNMANFYPHLFKGLIAGVPFVDLMRTMSNPRLPLTVIEYEEWGNPKREEDFHYMLTYSPYDNISRQNYPAILATTSLEDSRVSYAEAAKWIAKLRENHTGIEPILLKVHMEAGHSGESGRYASIKETAQEYAFVLSLLKMNK